jgi:serine phosphatase RsbU (regulator of sigma subunit)
MRMDSVAAARQIRLAPGDVLALISDGVYEFAAPDGSEFGEDGVASVIREGIDLPMDALARRLVDAAFAFGSGAPQADDITLVLLRRLPQATRSSA